MGFNLNPLSCAVLRSGRAANVGLFEKLTIRPTNISFFYVQYQYSLLQNPRPRISVSPTDSYQAVCSAQHRIRVQSLMPPPGLRIGVTLTRSDPKRESESEREDCRLATKRILSSLKGWGRGGAGRGSVSVLVKWRS